MAGHEGATMSEHPGACPACDGTTLIRSGHACGRQRWRCKGCGRQFTRTTPRGMPAATKREAVGLYCAGLSMSATGRRLGVSAQSVTRWVRDHARDHCPKPEPAGRPAGRAGGRGRDRRDVALRRKKARKLWIWKALERGTGRLIDWPCGDRERATLERLLGRLEPWGVRLLCTDDQAPYDAALPAGRHYIGQDQTQRSESNNARQRHWFARFRRRTCVISRSVEMVEATMALFAFYHRNGGELTPALVG
jgi:insertion element IS1 protein InsB